MAEAVATFGLALAIVGILAFFGGMIRDMMFDTDSMAFVGVGLASLIVGFALLLPAAIVSESQHSDVLMQQCLGDGHKQYECESIVRHAMGYDQHVYVHNY